MYQIINYILTSNVIVIGPALGPKNKTVHSGSAITDHGIQKVTTFSVKRQEIFGTKGNIISDARLEEEKCSISGKFTYQ